MPLGKVRGGWKRRSKVATTPDCLRNVLRRIAGFVSTNPERHLPYRPTMPRQERKRARTPVSGIWSPDSAHLVALVLCTLAASGCHGDNNRLVPRPRLVTTPTPVGQPGPDAVANVPPTTAPVAVVVPPVTVVAAGDIAICGNPGSAATASLIDGLPGDVLSLGDHVYMTGTAREFSECYEPTWGRHRARTYPTPGNHDYDTPGAQGYFGYFGSRAGPSGLGYYSVTAGAWRVYSLNSEVPAGPGSAQYAWLQQELAAATPPLVRSISFDGESEVSATISPACELAYWHKPLISSGRHGNNGQMQAIWQLLHEHGVDVVLAAHDHVYERFEPLDGRLRPDPTGIRSFVVGTGGAPLYDFPSIKPQSQIRGSAHGVLKLLLRSDGYDWEFVPVVGQSFTDAGSGSCR